MSITLGLTYCRSIFKFQNPYEHTCKKMTKSVGMLWKLRKFLPKKTLIFLYHAFVQLHLLFSIVDWGPIVSSNTLNQLQLLQNNNIRAIVGLKKSQHITSSYRDLEI